MQSVPIAKTLIWNEPFAHGKFLFVRLYSRVDTSAQRYFANNKIGVCDDVESRGAFRIDEVTPASIALVFPKTPTPSSRCTCGSVVSPRVIPEK